MLAVLLAIAGVVVMGVAERLEGVGPEGVLLTIGSALAAALYTVGGGGGEGGDMG